jgi:hypothetical protein
LFTSCRYCGFSETQGIRGHKKSRGLTAPALFILALFVYPTFKSEPKVLYRLETHYQTEMKPVSSLHQPMRYQP